MKFENTEVWGFKHSLRGMRNPMESWNKSDSLFGYYNYNSGEYEYLCSGCMDNDGNDYAIENPVIGKNDMQLAQKLIKAGTDHRKFMRQIFVSVDITAPLYWWKEFDTYKVGTVANSTGTMHKLADTAITLNCFETDGYNKEIAALPGFTFNFIEFLIMYLEELRLKYLETKDKKYWKELIRWLPESWLQTRTITMSYENIFAIVHQRKNHKLNEWNGQDNPALPNFISWAKSLPYADQLIFMDIMEE